MTYSPDSTKIAFTRDNDLYVVDIASGEETRLTFDGTNAISPATKTVIVFFII